MKITYLGNNNLTYLGSNQPLHWQLKELDYYLILLSFRIFVLLLPFPSVLSGPEPNFVLWKGKVNIIACSITNYDCLQMLGVILITVMIHIIHGEWRLISSKNKACTFLQKLFPVRKIENHTWTCLFQSQFHFWRSGLRRTSTFPNFLKF